MPDKLESSILPATATVTVLGQEVTIGRFDTEQSFSLLEPFFEVFEQLQAAGGALTPARLIGKCPVAVIAILAIALGESTEFVKRLPFNETLQVLVAVLETNLNFFIDQVQPEVLKLMTLATNHTASQ